MGEQRRGYVMLIRRGDPEITAAGLRGLLEGKTVLTTPGPSGHPSQPLRPGEPGHLPFQGRQDGEARAPATVRHSEAVRRVAMCRHTPEEWAAMIAQARYDYGQDRPTPKWAGKLLLAWAMLCQGVRNAYRAQDRVLK